MLLFFLGIRRHTRSTLFPYTTLFRSLRPHGTGLHAPSHRRDGATERSEEHTSELQSPVQLVCRLLLEKKNYYTKAGIYLCNGTSPLLWNSLNLRSKVSLFTKPFLSST